MGRLVRMVNFSGDRFYEKGDLVEVLEDYVQSGTIRCWKVRFSDGFHGTIFETSVALVSPLELLAEVAE